LSAALTDHNVARLDVPVDQAGGVRLRARADAQDLAVADGGKNLTRESSLPFHVRLSRSRSRRVSGLSRQRGWARLSRHLELDCAYLDDVTLIQRSPFPRRHPIPVH